MLEFLIFVFFAVAIIFVFIVKIFLYLDETWVGTAFRKLRLYVTDKDKYLYQKEQKRKWQVERMERHQKWLKDQEAKKLQKLQSEKQKQIEIKKNTAKDEDGVFLNPDGKNN